MAPLKVVLFLGSTRPTDKVGFLPGRVGERICKFLLANLPPDEFEVRVVDPTDDDYKLPLLEIPYHWSKMTKQPVAPNIQRLNDTVAWAESYIMVTPEYNHSVSPGLLNLLDHIAPLPYGGKMGLKPSMIVTYSMGKYGGSRAAVQLRASASEIGTVMCSRMVSIIEAHLCIDEDGNEIPDLNKKTPITEAFVQAREDFLFVGRALIKEKEATSKSSSKKAKL